MNFLTFFLLLFSITGTNMSWYGRKFRPRKIDPNFPRFYNVSSTRQVSINAGGSVIFYCYALGDPKPKLTWYHSYYDPLQTATPFIIPKEYKRRVFYRNKTQELVIRRAEAEDSGYYICNSTNIHGSTSYFYKLTVLVNSDNIIIKSDLTTLRPSISTLRPNITTLIPEITTLRSNITTLKPKRL